MRISLLQLILLIFLFFLIFRFNSNFIKNFCKSANNFFKNKRSTKSDKDKLNN